MTLDELKELLTRVTPGPWSIDHHGHGERAECAYLRLTGEYGPHQVIIDHRRDYSDPAPDARFIALSRTLLPAALDVVEAAKRNRYCWANSLPANLHVGKTCGKCPGCRIAAAIARFDSVLATAGTGSTDDALKEVGK